MEPLRRIAALAAAASLAACGGVPHAPDPTGRADADMLRVLTAYQELGAEPVNTLSVREARRQPTPAAAAAAAAQQLGVPAKQAVAKVSDLEMQTTTGPLHARVYVPQTGGPQPGSRAAPVIVYFHGGGWVTGDLDTDDATDRILANGAGAIVVSVQYRLAPEIAFPSAQDDAAAAYGWVLQNAASFGGDPRQVALAGEDAGGNLAIDTAIWARDSHLPAPTHLLLIDPMVGTDTTTPSYAATTEAVPLNRDAVDWYLKAFERSAGDASDPRLDVVGAADLRRLPPTTIVSAEIDPLRSEGEALAQKLTAARVSVQQRTYPGVTHAFFGMGAVVGQARRAEDFAIARLRSSFVQPAAVAPFAQPRAKVLRPLR